MRLGETDRLLIVGLTGGGKTFYTNKEIVEPFPGVVRIWDPHKNYSVGYFSHDIPEWAMKAGMARKFYDKKAYRKSFHEFAVTTMELGSDLIVVDEIFILTMCGAEDELAMLATQARHSGSAVVFIAQRAYNVPLIVRSQCSEVITFQQTDAHDIDALARMTGEPWIGCSAKAEDPCAALAREKCLKHLKMGEFFRAVVRSA